MSKIKIMILIVSLTGDAFAKDVHVRGYYKSNGTYVAPHIRSSPDGNRENNYGSARSAGSANYGGFTSPNLRDSDHDGTPNYLDHDDNNNGISDNDE
jgi:hypothetical protein